LPICRASRLARAAHGLGAKKSFTAGAGASLAAAAAALARTRIASCAVAIDRPEAKQLDDYYSAGGRGTHRRCAVSRQHLKTGRKRRAALPGTGRTGAQGRRRRARPEHGARWQPRQVQRDLANLPATSARRRFSPSRRAHSPSALARSACGCSTQPHPARKMAACSPLRRQPSGAAFHRAGTRGARKAQRRSCWSARRHLR